MHRIWFEQYSLSYKHFIILKDIFVIPYHIPKGILSQRGLPTRKSANSIARRWRRFVSVAPSPWSPIRGNPQANGAPHPPDSHRFFAGFLTFVDFFFMSKLCKYLRAMVEKRWQLDKFKWISETHKLTAKWSIRVVCLGACLAWSSWSKGGSRKSAKSGHLIVFATNYVFVKLIGMSTQLVFRPLRRSWAPSLCSAGRLANWPTGGRANRLTG